MIMPIDVPGSRCEFWELDAYPEGCLLSNPFSFQAKDEWVAFLAVCSGMGNYLADFPID